MTDADERKEEPEDVRELDGDTARAVADALATLGFYDGDPDAVTDGGFGERERDALESFRGMNNFENHDLAVIEDALARGWADAEGAGEERTADAEGAGEARMVDAIWHGLQRLDRE